MINAGTDPAFGRSVPAYVKEVIHLRCRRCDSSRLLRLDKKLSQDNDVFRCQECGFLFSPTLPLTADDAPENREPVPSRTVAVHSGYQARQ